jgi:O-antigen/teichoic acid export membrane protein
VSTPKSYLRKEMRFKEIALLDILASLSMTVIGPLMAWRGLGVWALVGEQVSGVIAITLVIWAFMRPWKPQWRLDRSLIRWYLNYGKFIVTTQTLKKVIDEFDDFWVGTALGANALGFYSRAYTFASYPRRVVSQPVTQVLFSAFAKVQDDRLRLSKAYYRASSLIVRAGFLLGGVFVLGAREFVLIFLTDQWLPMVLAFQLMVVFILLDPLRAVSSDLVNAVGHPEFYTRAQVAQCLLSIPLVLLGAGRWGIEGVAIAVDIVLVLGLFVILYQIRSIVRISFVRMLGCPLLALGIASLLGWLASGWLHGSVALHLAVKTAVFGGTYAIILLLIEGKEYLSYTRLIAEMLPGPPGYRRR